MTLKTLHATICNNFLGNLGKTRYRKRNPSSASQQVNYAESINLSVASHEIWIQFYRQYESKEVFQSIQCTCHHFENCQRLYIIPLAFNASFTSGNFPDKLKLARIKISLSLRKARDLTKTIKVQFLFFVILVKYLKKLYIITSVYRYLEDFKILYPLLLGFREKSLTMHVLTSITESICESIYNNELDCGIFIDLKKNFGYS